MVVGNDRIEQLVKDVAAVYKWIDTQIRRNKILAGQCNICGACCDFAKFDHRLFVTPPELMYLALSTGQENFLRMKDNKCPYQIEGKCTIHKYRFSGCRIFCCKGDRDFQSRLSESVLRKLKSICARYGVSYRYLDLASALDKFSTDTCQSAEESCPGGREG